MPMARRAGQSRVTLCMGALASGLAILLGFVLAPVNVPASEAYFTSRSELAGNSIALRSATPTPVPTWLAASVDLKPNSLGKKSEGRPVTALIELPAGWRMADVAIASLRLCLGTQPCTDGVHAGGKPKVDDADHDGIPDLKVTFSRSEVIALLHDITPPAWVTLTVSGQAGAQGFAGNDALKLVDPEREEVPTSTQSPATPAMTATCNPTGTGAPTATSTAAVQPSSTPAPTVTSAATATARPTITPSPSATAEPGVTPLPTVTSTPTARPAASTTPEPAATPTSRAATSMSGVACGLTAIQAPNTLGSTRAGLPVL